MNNSDWITIWGIAAGLFVTTIGSALLLSFKIGGLHQQVTSMAKNLDGVMRDIEKIRYTIGQILVKVDVLWKSHNARKE